MDKMQANSCRSARLHSVRSVCDQVYVPATDNRFYKSQSDRQRPSDALVDISQAVNPLGSCLQLATCPGVRK